jgi:hypothetical protein
MKNLPNVWPSSLETHISAVVVMAAIFSIPLRADSSSPSDYKETIEALITNREAVEHPEFARLYFSFFVPKDAIYGEKGQRRQAVRCEWWAEDKHGSPYLMIADTDFLVDFGVVYQVRRYERLEWIGGNPVREKVQPNQSTDPAHPFVTPSAEQLAHQT